MSTIEMLVGSMSVPMAPELDAQLKAEKHLNKVANFAVLSIAFFPNFVDSQ